MMSKSQAQRFRQLAAMVGNTPLLEIRLKHAGQKITVLAKAEYYNFTGSIKDRVALHMLQRAYEVGELTENQPICEATSGNTGIAFAAIGAYLGNPTTIFMPDWMSEERINLIRSFGADVRLVSKEEGGFTGAIELCKNFARTEKAYLPSQFANPANIETHATKTAPEIIRQMDRLGYRADGIVAGVGTGGTVMGLAQGFRRQWPDCQAFPLDPENSPTMLSGGRIIGAHRIAGIGDEFIPPILDLEKLDTILMVDDSDAINMSRRMAAELGLGVGISSGANLLGAVIAHDIIKAETDKQEVIIVTTFADDNKKYLSTDLMENQPVTEGHLAPEIELIDFIAHR